MKRLLIIRFSAIGDVAMTIPVIYACAVDNPQLSITILSREFLRPLFSRMPSNVEFKGVDLKKEYHGIGGLNKLYNELKKEGYDAVADFHDVLRSQYLRLRFLLNGTLVKHIQKGRSGKGRLTREHHKIKEPQKSSFQRYAEVLEHLGIQSSSHFTSLFPKGKGDLSSVVGITGEKETDKWVGIAPFAAHKGKIYPFERLKEVIKLLEKEPSVHIFMFGAGAQERAILEQCEQEFSHVTSLAGKLKMDTELIVMSHLNVMLSMDSANMHLASLVNTPVVSIWGATHPYAGFMGWDQKEEDAIQIDLPCRPCSIYGNKPCMRNDYACLNNIAPERIVAQLKKYLF